MPCIARYTFGRRLVLAVTTLLFLAGAAAWHGGSTVLAQETNVPPVALTLSNATIAENQPAGAVVGILSTSDPDDLVHTYTLAAGDGDTHNDQFQLDGDQLKSRASFDFETQNSYSIRVESRDSADQPIAASFAITVTDVDDVPSAVADTATVAENSAFTVIPVLDNDTDPDGGPKRVDQVTQPISGTVEIATDGSGIRYQPAADFCTDPPGDAPDTFTYRLAPGGAQADVRMTVTCAVDDPVEPIGSSVPEVNFPPTLILLSNTSVNENAAISTTVGTFSTVDLDLPSDSHTYTFVAGPGDTGNSQFAIVGDQLKTKAVFNHEANDSYSIRVISTDASNEPSLPQVFTIIVNDVNEKPTNIALTPSTIDENKPAVTLVGTLTTTDPDDGDSHTYALDAGAGDTDNDKFQVLNGNELWTKISFNFEAKSSYSVRINSTDSGSLSVAKSLAVQVNNVNEPPTNIALSNTNVPENQPSGTVVGLLSTTDPDANDSHTYALVDNATYPDNTAFQITGGQLKTNAVFDREAKASYTIRIQSTDSGNLSFAKDFTITITNVDEPPTAVDDPVTVAEDSGFTDIDVLANDTDPDGGSKVVNTFTQPANGEVEGPGVRYKPDRDYCNDPPGTTTDDFTYRLSPGASEAKVLVTVTCVDDGIVAGDASLLVEPETPLVINTVQYVTDPDGDLDPSSTKVVDGPEHGEVSINRNNGRITYTADANYLGPDAFDYKICDTNDNCDTGTITLLIAAVDLTLSKVADVISVEPGDLIVYTLAYENLGNADANGVTILDTVPENTVFAAEASTSAWNCQDGNPAGTNCKVNVNTVAEGESGSVQFAVRVLSPLRVFAETIVNQAEIKDNGANGPELTPDDNVAEASTPINAAIEFNAEKVDGLLIDVDTDGVPGPGDTLRYSVTMTVTGNAPALNVSFVDALDPATDLVVGSVTPSDGTVVSGNGSGDTGVEVALGDLRVGKTVRITFDAEIRNPLPAGTNEVSNQGVISGANFPSAVTDDPDSPQVGDPTTTLLAAKAELSVFKSVTVAIDADSNSVASPGDTLWYTITVVNTGNQTVAGILVKDNLDPNTTLVEGSVNPSRGTVVSGAGGEEADIAVDVGTLIGNGDSIQVTFRARINQSIGGAVDEIVNQAVVSSDNLPDVLSDDPAFAGPADPTRITVNANAKIFLTLADFFVADFDGNGVLSQGDLLIYRLEIFNNGNRAATNLVLEQRFDGSTALLPGTVSTTAGNIELGNSDADEMVQFSAAVLAGGARISLSYQVRVADVTDRTAVQNQATLRYINHDVLVNIRSDDPDTATQNDATRSPLGDATGTGNDIYLPLIARR